LDDLNVPLPTTPDLGLLSDVQATTPDQFPDGWKVVQLGEIADLRLGRTPARKEARYWQDGLIPWVSIADLNNGGVSHTKEKISKAAFEEVFHGEVSSKGTLLLSFKLTIGRVGVLQVDAGHNEAIASVFLMNQETSQEYLFYFLQSIDYDTYIDDYVKGKTLNKRKLNLLPISLPPLHEQQAIAHVLRIVQKAIEATEKVIATTRELKRSLMNHLFTYGPTPVDEADQVPLKDTEIGLVPEHWEATRLGEVCSISTGTTPSTKVQEYYAGHIPFIKTSEIVNNVIEKTSTYIRVYPRTSL
jgi:type I restriction enzyme, S subunit